MSEYLMQKICLSSFMLMSSAVILIASPIRGNASEGHLLSPEQVAALTSLPIPIVAPTYLPEGFQVFRVDGGTVQYDNGEDDSGYSIEYQRDDNTCFTIRSVKDDAYGLEQVGQVETAVGTVNIYQDESSPYRSMQSFIPVRGNPIMISPEGRLNPTTGNYEPCRMLDRAEYEQILRSIELISD